MKTPGESGDVNNKCKHELKINISKIYYIWLTLLRRISGETTFIGWQQFQKHNTQKTESSV